MELDFLPATVYQPPRSRPARSNNLNTIMEEEQRSEVRPPLGADRLARKGRLAAVPQVVTSLRAPSPPSRVPSPSSSVSSARLTWASSETASTMESGTDFEDLYEPVEVDPDTDDEFVPALVADRPDGCDSTPILTRRMSLGVENKSAVSVPAAQDPSGGRDLKHMAVPLTPPPRIPVSLTLLTHDIPAISSPPSLDESLTSDQPPHSEAPPTPRERSEEVSDAWDGGVQLNPEALATLQLLSTDESDETLESAIEVPEPEPLDPPSRRHTIDVDTSCASPSFAILARLDIPSPSGFFASLASGTRRTWCPSALLPSTTTAERFYQCPWSRPSDRTIEQIVEVRDTDTNGPSTAQLITPRPLGRHQVSQELDLAQETADECIEEILSPKSPATSAAFDRTASWLSAQMDYLASVGESPNGPGRADLLEEFLGMDESSRGSSPRADVGEKAIGDEAGETEAVDTALWDLFLSLLRKSAVTDAFVHSQPRFDAIQVGRICSPDTHRRQLLGQIQYKADAPPSEGCDDESLASIPTTKERVALRQMCAAHWNVEAMKYLNFGKLLTSPATKFITRKSISVYSRLIDRSRILDLGGQPNCDWAWHCADEYPMSQIYTVTPTSSRLPSSSQTRGPQNHSQFSAPRLWELPFPDNHFDVISARNLYTILKADRSSGETQDEYDLCLKECLRCLKPGGYLEFSLLDAELVHAGPLGTAMSVEFGFNLKTRGYDPSPTRAWLGRLKKAGFAQVKRAWMFLPLGVPGRGASEDLYDDSLLGSFGRGRDGGKDERTMVGTTDAIAPISGLVGLRAWESWMLKLQMEAGKTEESLLEGVSTVVQEARSHGTGWRSLNGWARKAATRED